MISICRRSHAFAHDSDMPFAVRRWPLALLPVRWRCSHRCSQRTGRFTAEGRDGTQPRLFVILYAPTGPSKAGQSIPGLMRAIPRRESLSLGPTAASARMDRGPRCRVQTRGAHSQDSHGIKRVNRGVSCAGVEDASREEVYAAELCQRREPWRREYPKLVSQCIVSLGVS